MTGAKRRRRVALNKLYHQTGFLRNFYLTGAGGVSALTSLHA
jgi:hypothetical protein